ncbi:MAG: sulfatase [Verrucomicrobiota bacterium]
MSLWRLTRTSGGMDNKFNELARSDHMGFLIRENLHVLAGYVLLWAAAAMLVIPLAALLRKKLPRNRIALIALGFTITAVLHGYFVLRLVKTRPYFLNETDFGHWYFRLLDVVPEAAKPAVFTGMFTILPVIVVCWAAWWHLRHRPRTTTCLLLAAAGLFFLPPLWQKIRKAPVVLASGKNNPPNVIIIGSDSLRGNRLGCAGYRPARNDGPAAAGVSPRIDQLAARSAHFTRCHTAIASTLESGVQLMASQYPHTFGIRQMFPNRDTVEKMARDTVPLAALLRERGYDTAAIGDWCAGYYHVTPLGFEDISVSSFDNFKIYMSQAVVMAHFAVPLYFDNPLGYRLFPQLESFAQFVTPGVVTRRVTDRLETVAQTRRPFFWHVFYSCNHLPFRSSEPFVSMFADPAYRGANKNGVDFDIDQFIGGTDLESKWKALPSEEVRQIRALYDGCTRQFDTCVGEILDALKRNHLDENTIVIITADHGDDLYDPGVTLGHGLSFNGAAPSYHVPMIVHLPGASAQVVEETVRLIDVAPTLADLCGAKQPANWEGQSFASWLRGESPRQTRPFFAETGFPFIQFRVPGIERPKLPPMDELTTIDPSYNYQFVLKDKYLAPLIAAKQRCLATRDWKTVCTPAADGSRHFSLYQISKDPDCTHDLARSRPEVLAPMRAALERWIDEHAETPVAAIFPGGEPE